MKLKSTFSGSTSWLAILGASLLWTWQDSGIFGKSLYSYATGQSVIGIAFIIVFVVNIVCFIALLLRIPQIEKLSHWSRKSVLLFAFLGALGSLIVLFSQFLSIAALRYLGSCLMGGAVGYLIIVWGWVCVAQGPSKAVIHISGAWALSLPMNILCAALRPLAGGMFVSLLPLVSGIIFLAIAGLQKSETYAIEAISFQKTKREDGWHKIAGVDLKLTLLILVFCAVFGLMYFYEVLNPYISLQHGTTDIVSVRGLTALLFFIAGITYFKEKIRSLFKVFLFVMAAGVFIMAVGSFIQGMSFGSRLFISAGYAGFDILVWTMIAFHSYISDNSQVKTVIIVMLTEQVGILFGAIIGIMVSTANLGSYAEGIVLTALSFFLLITLVGFTEYGSRLWSLLSNSIKPEEARKNNFQLAGQYELTKREVEILGLFIEGRSMRYIADKFVISENTVKTHIRHIYTKLDIHNKQELLDMVEKNSR